MVVKKFFKIFSTTIVVSFFTALIVSPANAGAPECFLTRPQTCSTYDYISESINGYGQVCRTRYYSDGVSQSGEGLGCVGSIKSEEKPKIDLVEPIKTTDPSVSSITINPVIENKNQLPTEIIANPQVTTNPNIVGNRNNVSSVINNTNTTNNSVTNNTTNNVNNVVGNASSIVSNKSEYKTIEVTGGILVIGENGFEKFFPTTEKNNSKSVAPTDSQISYLEKSELPASVQKSINRLPKEISQKKKLRLSIALKNAESITEDICIIENRRMSFVSKGTCVLEIPVGEGIYEHEINVIK